MDTAVIYTRLSHDKRKGKVGEGLAIERQLGDGTGLAKRLKVKVVAHLSDNSISAYSGKKRPGYQRLLEMIRAGEVDVVIVWHHDRLHRSPLELEEYIAACEQHDVATHTVMAGPLDLATPTGRMQARGVGNFARYESEIKRDRVMSAQRQAREAGRRHGGGPRAFGWTRTMVVGQPTRYEPHGAEAPLLVKAVGDVLAGVSLRSIISAWNAAGVTTTTGRPWSYPQLRSVLKRDSNGQLVGADTQRALVAFLNRPERRLAPTWQPRWLCSGIARCGRCSAVLRSAGYTRADGTRTRIYRCMGEHCGLGIKVEMLDRRVRHAVAEVYRTTDPEQLPRVGADTTAQIVAARGQLAEVAQAKERNLRLLEAGAYSEAELLERSLELNARRLDLENQVGRLLEQDAHASMVLQAGSAMLTADDSIGRNLDLIELAERFDQLPLEARRTLVRSLLTVTVRPGRGADRVDVCRRVPGR